MRAPAQAWTCAWLALKAPSAFPCAEQRAQDAARAPSVPAQGLPSEQASVQLCGREPARPQALTPSAMQQEQLRSPPELDAQQRCDPVFLLPLIAVRAVPWCPPRADFPVDEFPSAESPPAESALQPEELHLEWL
jgi:hypothetical protein